MAAIDESKGYTDTQLTDYSTTAQMTQAITDALVPFETAAQRDAAIAAALAAYYTSAQTDAVIAAAIAPYYTSAQTDAAIAAAVALSNGQSWTGGATFNLLRASNVLRNLSVAGALTATFQNLDDTILIESDSYARSETYTQAETGAAITAAIDALNLSQYRTEVQVLALIAGELVPYWDQTEVSTYVAGELSFYATSSSVTSAISSALSSYDNSSQVDSKIITALLDFYTRTEVDQQIANALGNVDLSNYYTQAETQSYVANELLAYYPRTELDSQLTATFTQYWTSSRTQTEIDDAIAGAGFLTQALADQRYFAVSANASFESLARTNVTPPMIKALLPRAPLAASTILTDTTLELTCDAYTKAEADGRYLSSSNFAPLDARYFARNPAVAEGNGLFHLVQEQFTPNFIRSLLFRPPLTGQAILGNFSVIEIEADCWSKAQSDSRYPLGSGRRQGSLAQQSQGSRPGLCRGCRFRCSRRRLRSGCEALRCFRLSKLLGSEALDVLDGLPFHLRRSLPRPLQQGPHFRRPSDDLRWWHFVRWGGQSRGPPRDAKGPVQPVAATPQGQHRLVLRHARHRRRRARRPSRHDRLRGLNAALPHAASQRRGPRRVQAVVAQRLPGIHAPVVAVGQKRRPRELSWRSWKRSSTVPLVGRFKGCSRIQARVGQRRFANGLGGIGVIIEIEVAGSVDAGLAVGQVQGQGLALLDVP